MSIRPPLNALHTFCMVVTHGGIRQAAQILCITPGAVSKQIKLLEEHFKELLFYRLAGSLASPTPAGTRLYDRVAHEMRVIGEALGEGVGASRHTTILVDTSVTLAMHWLIPLLPRFNERHPDIRVQVRTMDGPIETTAPADIFIRRDESELRGLPHQTFAVEWSVLVGTPAFKANFPPSGFQGMSWIHNVPRIGMRSRDDLWHKWSVAHGIAGSLAPTIEYDNTVLSIQAALHGLGALVVPKAFVSSMLDNKTLVMLAPGRIRSGTYSYAVGRHQDALRVRTFTNWLMDREQQSDFRADVTPH